MAVKQGKISVFFHLIYITLCLHFMYRKDGCFKLATYDLVEFPLKIKFVSRKCLIFLKLSKNCYQYPICNDIFGFCASKYISNTVYISNLSQQIPEIWLFIGTLAAILKNCHGGQTRQNQNVHPPRLYSLVSILNI